MEQARALLLATKLPLKQVALQAGYENTGFFYRLFQRMNGVSPTEYRRGKRAGQEDSGQQSNILSPTRKVCVSFSSLCGLRISTRFKTVQPCLHTPQRFSPQHSSEPYRYPASDISLKLQNPLFPDNLSPRTLPMRCQDKHLYALPACDHIHRKFTFESKKIEPGTCFLDSWLISAIYIFWSVFNFLTSSTERPTNSAIFSSVIVPSSSIFFATFIIPSFNV